MLLQTSSIWAVVPAAGIGRRMASERPKQYLPLAGETILEVTLNKLISLEWIQGVVVAIHPKDTYWNNLPISTHSKIHVVPGGDERSDSVFSALKYLKNSCAENNPAWVMVHDAARPCVSLEKMDTLARECLSQKCGGILAARISDTVKLAANVDSEKNDIEIDSTLNRNLLWAAHTPQMFMLTELLSALEFCNLKKYPVTDEASAIEKLGRKTRLVEDRKDNIKVTVPEDLSWAEHILKLQMSNKKEAL